MTNKDNREKENQIKREEMPPIPDAIIPSDDARDFEKSALQEEPRKVELPPGGGGSLAEGMSLAQDLSDIQTAMKKLFPDTLNNNSVMIARIQPDLFLTLLNIMTLEDVMNKQPNEPIDVMACLRDNYVRLSVGLDGEGRIDMAELAGAARAEKNRRDNISRLGSL